MSTDSETRLPLAAATAFAGSTILFAGTLVTAIAYNGPTMEPYSLANHFFSELGWVKTSRAAWLFNWSLVLGFLTFLPLMIALGRHTQTRLGYVASFFGSCAMLAGTCVGILPMGNLKPHLWAAGIFFPVWSMAILLFTLAFFRRWNPRPSYPLVVTGMICCVFCLSFLFFPKDSLVKAMHQVNNGTFRRPDIWWFALMEWCVVLSSGLWGCTAALVLWRKRKEKNRDTPLSLH